MKINIKKIIAFLLLFILIISVFTLTSNAEDENDNYSDKMGALVTGSWSDTTDASDKVSGLLTTIIVGVKITAVAIAIIMLLVVGMKYVVSSPGDRADIKKSAIVYVVGAFVLFGVSGILTILEQVSRVINVTESN